MFWATPAKLSSGNFTHVPSVENCTLVGYIRCWENFSCYSVLAPIREGEGRGATRLFISQVSLWHPQKVREATTPKGNQILTGPLHHTNARHNVKACITSRSITKPQTDGSSLKILATPVTWIHPSSTTTSRHPSLYTIPHQARWKLHSSLENEDGHKFLRGPTINHQ